MPLNSVGAAQSIKLRRTWERARKGWDVIGEQRIFWNPARRWNFTVSTILLNVWKMFFWRLDTSSRLHTAKASYVKRTRERIQETCLTLVTYERELYWRRESLEHNKSANGEIMLINRKWHTCSRHLIFPILVNWILRLRAFIVDFHPKNVTENWQFSTFSPTFLSLVLTNLLTIHENSRQVCCFWICNEELSSTAGA